MIRSIKCLLTAMTLISVQSVFAMPSSNEIDYYTLVEPTITVIEDDLSYVPMVGGLNRECNEARTYEVVYGDEVSDSNPANLGTVIIVADQIVNLGKKIFDVIKAGVPVVNIKTDSASALPAGIKCWTDLGGWKMPKVNTYRFVYKNKMGIEVVDFTYRVMFTAGGSADGVGRYITNATILPTNIHVAYGFVFDANVSIPSVFNMGTKAKPIAGMQMDINWKIHGVIPVNVVQRTESYHVSGRNEIKELR